MLPIIQSYFSVLMLLGTSQGLLSIYLLLKNKDKPYSNNMLALMLFTWSFSSYWFFAFIAKGPLFSVTLTTFIGPMLALTLFPPIYLYVKYLFYEYEKFQIEDHLHFLPIYLYLIFTSYLYIDSDFSIAAMRKHEWFDGRRIACSYIATLQGPFYFFKTNKILKIRRENLEKNYSEIESRKLEWFRLINFSFAVVFILGGVSTLLRSNYINPYYLYLSYHAIIAVSLFYISINIYKYPLLFTKTKPEIDLSFSNQAAIILEEKKPDNPNNRIPEESKEKIIIQKIEAAMQTDKLYRNVNLSLNDLAESIGESRNAISSALNNSLNKTFYNYINELRIEESKQLLSDPATKHFSIEGIATHAGFKSMSVFYKFFKDNEKMTPAVYRKQNMK